MERHVVVRAEIPTDLRWLQAELPEVLIVQPSLRLAIHQRDQSLHPVRFPARCPERVAAPARAEPGEHRFAYAREETDVLRARLAGGARRPAEDSRRGYAGDEEAVVRGVFFEERAPHFCFRRQWPDRRVSRRHTEHVTAA